MRIRAKYNIYWALQDPSRPSLSYRWPQVHVDQACWAWSCNGNGSSEDNPRRALPAPRLGDFTVTKGKLGADGWVSGERNDKGIFEIKVRYDPAPDMLEWWAEKDCNYLVRIEREGRLRELEPDVWCLREMEHAQSRDMGEWWHEKLQLPNIGEILKRAKRDHQQWVAREEREQAAREVKEREAREAQELAAIKAREKQEREERDARERAERESQVRLDQLRKKLQPFVELTKKLDPLVQAVQAKISGVRLDLSDLPLKLDERCWRELAALFATINNFTEVNLSNTGLDQRTWEEILLPSLINNPNLTASPDTTLSIISERNPCSFNYNPSQLLEVIAARQLAILQAKYAATTSALRKLIKNPGLVNLDLSNQPLTPEHMDLVCQIVATCPNLRTLNLSNTGLSYEAARVLVVGLHQHHALQSIDVSGCALPKSIVLQLQAQLRYAGGKIVGAEGAMRDVLPPQQAARQKIIEAVPVHLRCALTHKIMLDPVYAADGGCYEREAIQAWLENNDPSISPVTKEPLEHKYVCPAPRVKAEITALLAQQPLLVGSDEIYLSQKLIAHFLQTIAEKKVAAFTAMLKEEPRLLTCSLDETNTTLLTAVSRQEDATLLTAAIDALGDLFWQAPEIVRDSGMKFFRDIALHMGINGAQIMARKFAWGREELLLHLREIETWPQEEFAAASKIAHVCLDWWLQQEKCAPTMFLHFVAQHLHNPQFAAYFIADMEKNHGVEFMREAAFAKNTAGQTGMAVIAQTQADNVVLALWQKLNFTAEELYKLLLCCDDKNWNVAHMVARYRQGEALQYIVDVLSVAQLNQLLVMKTAAAENLLWLAAKNQDTATFKILLEKVSPEAIRAVVQDKLSEFTASIVPPQNPENAALLLSKYNLISECEKLQQDVNQALQILTSGEFKVGWGGQYSALLERWEKLQRHFAAVLEGSADYRVVQQLQASWQQLLAVHALYQHLHTELDIADFAPILRKLLAQLLGTAPALVWQWQMTATSWQLLLDALRDVVVADKFVTRHFTFERVQLRPNLWREFIESLPKDISDLGISLPGSFHEDLFLAHPALVVLDLSDNPERAKGILYALKTQLGGHDKLQSLKLNNIGLDKNSWLLLVELVSSLPALNYLELRNNNLSEIDAEQFGAFLQYLSRNPALRHLDLRGCKITPQQIDQLNRALLHGNLNLTSCAIDSDLVNVDQLQELARILQRNHDRDRLEKQYHKMRQNHDELNGVLLKLSLQQDMPSLLRLADGFAKQYQENIVALKEFAAHDYPSPRLRDELRTMHAQDGALLVRLWAYIISNLEIEASADIAKCYTMADRFRQEFIPQHQEAAAGLSNAYALRLLQMQMQSTIDFSFFKQALAVINKIPLQLVSPENVACFKKNGLAYMQYCEQLLHETRDVNVSIAIYYDLLELVNSAAFLLYQEKEEIGIRQNIYKLLLDLIMQYCQDKPLNLQPRDYMQLLELMHSVPRDYRAMDGVVEVLVRLVKSFMLNRLAALKDGIRFFDRLSFDKQEIVLLMRQITQLQDTKENILSSIHRLFFEFCNRHQRQMGSYQQFVQIQDFLGMAIRYYMQPSAPSAPLLGADEAHGKGKVLSEEYAVTKDEMPIPMPIPTLEPREAPAPSAPPLLPEEMDSVGSVQQKRLPIHELLIKCQQQEIDLAGEDIPKQFKCPISLHIMEDPVIIETGRTFDRNQIIEWFKQHDTDPVSGEKVENRAILIPAVERQGEIIEHLEGILRQHSPQHEVRP